MATPEFELGIKLESIFMPAARKQRDALYRLEHGIPQPARLVHYTSAEAALSIIRTKRIWMRNATCMADYREVQHGYEILHRFFADAAKAKPFFDALDACFPGLAGEAINLFNQWWAYIRVNTFITSISEHDDSEDFHGRLSMWRAFGGNVARVAAVLRMPWYSGGAQALNLIFSPVAYLREDEVHGVIATVVDNVRRECDFIRSVGRTHILGTVFEMLAAGVTCLKHDGFREEREWRAIYAPKRRHSALIDPATEVVAGIPQTVYKLPLDVNKSPALADLDLAKILDG